MSESEADYPFRLWLRRLGSSENCIVEVGRRSGRINQSQCSIPGTVIGWFFRFCYRLRQFGFHCITSGRSQKRSRKKMSTFWFFRLRFRWAYDTPYDCDLWFSLDHMRSYDSDFVDSQNQPLTAIERFHVTWRRPYCIKMSRNCLFSRKHFLRRWLEVKNKSNVFQRCLYSYYNAFRHHRGQNVLWAHPVHKFRPLW